MVAVETDLELATRLHARFDDAPAVHVRHADMLTLPFPRRHYKVFANIPFNATAAIVNRLTQARHPPEDSYLVVQAEAAERFTGHRAGRSSRHCSSPGSNPRWCTALAAPTLLLRRLWTR